MARVPGSDGRLVGNQVVGVIHTEKLRSVHTPQSLPSESPDTIVRIIFADRSLTAAAG